jgi:acyl-CoA thioester hydrolase
VFEPQPITYRGAVYPWHCDQMGHMNVMWYVGKFDEATWNLLAMMNITRQYLLENRRGIVGVQQNITYKRELFAGDTVTVRSRVNEVRQKVLRFTHEMFENTTEELAAIMELTAVHIDSDIRKSVPFPKEIEERARALLSTLQD